MASGTGSNHLSARSSELSHTPEGTSTPPICNKRLGSPLEGSHVMLLFVSTVLHIAQNVECAAINQNPPMTTGHMSILRFVPFRYGPKCGIFGLPDNARRYVRAAIATASSTTGTHVRGAAASQPNAPGMCGMCGIKAGVTR